MGTPRQPQLPGMVPEGHADLPDQISDGFIDIVSAVSQAESARLQEQVPDEHYRSAFVRLIRNLAPDGKDIERIHILRTAGGTQREAELTRDTVSLIRQTFPIGPLDAGAEPTEVVGILRALSLDKRYLRLVPEQGKSIPCTYNREVLPDDAVGPYVNHSVRAIGEMRGGRLHVYDIVDDVPSDTPPKEDTDPLTT